MILTASEIADASKYASLWEVGEYLGEAIVFLACVGEFIAEHTKLRTDDWRHSLGRRSLVALIVGLGIGLLSLIKTNSLSGSVIVSLGNEIGVAGTKAQQASDSSSSALSKAGQAKDESASALGLARGARKEADDFEKRLGTAEQKADDAEKSVSSSLARLKKAEAESARIAARLASRTLSHLEVRAISRDLLPFAGQEYNVVTYSDSPECMGISNQLIAALELAKWKRVPHPEVVGLMAGFVGVHVIRHPDADEQTKRAVDVLVSALNGHHIEAFWRQESRQNNPKNNEIAVNVGTKP